MPPGVVAGTHLLCPAIDALRESGEKFPKCGYFRRRCLTVLGNRRRDSLVGQLGKLRGTQRVRAFTGATSRLPTRRTQRVPLPTCPTNPVHAAFPNPVKRPRAGGA